MRPTPDDELQCFRRTGRIGDRGPTFGLDDEAIKAAKRWLFRPGIRYGEPVAMLVTIELTFKLVKSQ